jgi:hypothetical protein
MARQSQLLYPYSKVSGDFAPNPYFAAFASLPGTFMRGMFTTANHQCHYWRLPQLRAFRMRVQVSYVSDNQL